MDLLPFFRWCDSTWLSVTIRESRVLFPIIEALHLVGITLLLGTTLIVDIRLFNLGMRQQKVPSLASQLAPWNLASLVVVVATGIMLFLSEAMKCYASGPFQVKMLLLFLAILFQFTVYRRFTESEKTRFTPAKSWGLGLTSLCLWFGVGLAGRAIGFF